MRLRAYRGTILAAAFDDGRPAAYYGEHGRRVRALVEAPATGERRGKRGRWRARAHRAELPAHGFVLVEAGGVDRDGGHPAG